MTIINARHFFSKICEKHFLIQIRGPNAWVTRQWGHSGMRRLRGKGEAAWVVTEVEELQSVLFAPLFNALHGVAIANLLKRKIAEFVEAR